MKRRILGCLGISLALLLLLVGTVAFQLGRHMMIRDRVVFAIPGTSFELEHSRIGIHPMVAEYDRDITFRVGGKNVATVPLEIDTCGGYPINCYLIETPDVSLLRLDDAVSEHLIDLTNQSLYIIVRAMGEPYVGKGDSNTWSTDWMVLNDDPSTLEVTIGGAPAIPLAQFVGDVGERYVGRLQGKSGRLRFVPAAESPEIKINHLFDR